MPLMSLRNVKKQQQQQQKKVNSKHIFLQCIFGSREEFSPMNVISEKKLCTCSTFFLISKKKTLHVQHTFFLISKKTTLHVQHTFLYISLPLFYATESSFYFIFTRFMEEMFVFVFTLFFHCRSFSLW